MSHSPAAQAVKIAAKQLTFTPRGRVPTVAVMAPKKPETGSTKVFRIWNQKEAPDRERVGLCSKMVRHLEVAREAIKDDPEPGFSNLTRKIRNWVEVV
ncbi:MAG: hypothetical protein J7J76_06525 [Candidatus Latescibacteria bacterium]|nr:hypothetical protein [Candidatus Latescibacterota bacterium]